MNRKYIFFWNDSVMKYSMVENGIENEEDFTSADFFIDENEKDSYI